MWSNLGYMRRAKIVCTLGPATESPEQVQALVDAGMNVARINRSHGSAKDQEVVIDRVRAAAAASGRPVAILVDLQGPKIRLGRFVDDQKVMLNKGDEFTITIDDVLGTVKRASTTLQGSAWRLRSWRHATYRRRQRGHSRCGRHRH